MGKSPHPAAVIFDMDGVLVDTEPLHARIACRAARNGGLEMALSDFDRYIGIPDREMWTDICRRFSIPGREKELAAAQRELTLAEFAAADLRPIDGIGELIADLRCTGLPLGLASSSERELIELILARTELRSCFRVVVGRDEVARGKPAPDLYLTACGLLGIDPKRAIAIEDSEPGLRAAAAAGCLRIAYCPDGRPPLCDDPPDVTVASFGPAERRRILALAAAGPAASA